MKSFPRFAFLFLLAPFLNVAHSSDYEPLNNLTFSSKKYSCAVHIKMQGSTMHVTWLKKTPNSQECIDHGTQGALDCNQRNLCLGEVSFPGKVRTVYIKRMNGLDIGYFWYQTWRHDGKKWHHEVNPQSSERLSPTRSRKY